MHLKWQWRLLSCSRVLSTRQGWSFYHNFGHSFCPVRSPGYITVIFFFNVVISHSIGSSDIAILSPSVFLIADECSVLQWHSAGLPQRTGVQVPKWKDIIEDCRNVLHFCHPWQPVFLSTSCVDTLLQEAPGCSRSQYSLGLVKTVISFQ